jgi:hypothetical protein
LKLGQLNAINALTRLVGDHEGAVLLIDNNSGVSNARALDLRVESGRAPIVVNPEAATAKNLSADELDGKSSEAFLSASVYEMRRDIVMGHCHLAKHTPGGARRVRRGGRGFGRGLRRVGSGHANHE